MVPTDRAVTRRWPCTDRRAAPPAAGRQPSDIRRHGFSSSRHEGVAFDGHRLRSRTCRPSRWRTARCPEAEARAAPRSCAAVNSGCTRVPSLTRMRERRDHDARHLITARTLVLVPRDEDRGVPGPVLRGRHRAPARSSAGICLRPRSMPSCMSLIRFGVTNVNRALRSGVAAKRHVVSAAFLAEVRVVRLGVVPDRVLAGVALGAVATASPAPATATPRPAAG